jgi:hypothetical protein
MAQCIRREDDGSRCKDDARPGRLYCERHREALPHKKHARKKSTKKAKKGKR